MYFEIFFIFIIGLSIGSFINVCIYRLPLGVSLNKSSSCLSCNQKINFYDNIPIISFFLLNGRCRNCKKKLSYQYPLIEFLTSLSGVLFYLIYGLDYNFIVSFLFINALIVIILTDYQHYIIPNEISYSYIIIGIIISFLNLSIFEISIIQSLIGGSVSGLILFITSKLFLLIRKKEGMGMGDIKLIAMIGFWMGLSNTIIVIIISALLGSLVGIFLILSKKMNKTQYLPYGSFIGITVILVWFLNIFTGIDLSNIFMVN